MKNYETDNLGKFTGLGKHVFEPEGAPIHLEGKVFLKDRIGLNSMEVSLNIDEPGTGMTFFHSHCSNEEVYIFVGGKGEMMIDDERFSVEEGSVVRVAPDAKRAWWNTGSEPLLYICAQAKSNSLETPALEDGVLYDDPTPWA